VPASLALTVLAWVSRAGRGICEGELEKVPVWPALERALGVPLIVPVCDIVARWYALGISVTDGECVVYQGRPWLRSCRRSPAARL
jgi:hypothetical protein